MHIWIILGIFKLDNHIPPSPRSPTFLAQRLTRCTRDGVDVVLFKLVVTTKRDIGIGSEFTKCYKNIRKYNFFKKLECLWKRKKTQFCSQVVLCLWRCSINPVAGTGLNIWCALSHWVLSWTLGSCRSGIGEVGNFLLVNSLQGTGSSSETQAASAWKKENTEGEGHLAFPWWTSGLNLCLLFGYKTSMICAKYACDTWVYRRLMIYLCTIFHWTNSPFPCESKLPQVAGGLLQAGGLLFAAVNYLLQTQGPPW